MFSAEAGIGNIVAPENVQARDVQKSGKWSIDVSWVMPYSTDLVSFNVRRLEFKILNYGLIYFEPLIPQCNKKIKKNLFGH